MVKRYRNLNEVFAALAHPSRQKIVLRLSRGDATVGELAKPLRISLPAVTKHLDVLERAGLIQRSVRAQWRLCSLQIAPLSHAEQWLAEQRRIWESRLDRLEQCLEDLQTHQKGSDHEE